MTTPTITVIERKEHGTRYRISGGEIASDWKKALRNGEEPWCMFTMWPGSDHVGSYGGSVWPTAWPALFSPVPCTAAFGSGGIILTPAGRAAVDAASPRCTCKTPCVVKDNRCDYCGGFAP